MALPHFQRFGHKKSIGINRFGIVGRKAFVELGVSGDPAGLQQRRLHRDIFGRLVQAFRQSAHAGANLQATVPATADKGFNAHLCRRVGIGRLAIRRQHQYIHIRVGKQLAPAKSAYRNQRERCRQARQVPQRLQTLVCQASQLAQPGANPSRGSSACAQVRKNNRFFLLIIRLDVNRSGHCLLQNT